MNDYANDWYDQSQHVFKTLIIWNYELLFYVKDLISENKFHIKNIGMCG